ncbi:MAG: PRC-barrel domain-containing protein [Gemmatimonadaceae bacterium]|nr:PRC-barrel domain-containing protein [Gemmatimonadaceae bacterium]
MKDLEKYAVLASDGEVGTVTDFLVDDEHWTIRYLVVDTGGFFGGRNVLISPMAFRTVDWSTRAFHLALTMEQVKGSPDINTETPVSRQHERAYNRYYGYSPYWSSMGAWGMGMYPSLLAGSGLTDAMPAPDEEPSGDAHLRSASEVRGYHLQGTDDAVGHVEDFIADDETWGVHYLVVDTSNWWFGKQVLIAPRWATRVSWPERKVFVDLTREAIKGSPEWDGSAAVNREYEQRLYDYFGRPVYWGSEGHPREAQPSHADTDKDTAPVAAEPPNTTSFGWLTTPKFGAAGSGGAELEPVPKRE